MMIEIEYRICREDSLVATISSPKRHILWNRNGLYKLFSSAFIENIGEFCQGDYNKATLHWHEGASISSDTAKLLIGNDEDN